MTLFNLETGKPLVLPKDNEAIVSLIGNSKTGKGKMKIFTVNNNGQFNIYKSDIDTVGDCFTFSVSDFYKTNVFSYADFDIINIPKDSVKIILSKVYLTPSYWTNSCGSDCYLIDNRRTFKKEKFIVRTPYISYMVKRLPEKIDQKMLNVMYATDLKFDIIKE